MTTADPLRQLVVTADAAAVLGRTGQATSRAPWARRGCVRDLLDREYVVPVVPEVVLVPEPVTLGGHKLVRAHVVLQHAVLALGEVEAGDEVRRPAIDTGAEPVQVAVGPPHGCPDHFVQTGQRQIAGQLEAPPHRGFGAAQIEADPEAPGDVRNREHLRSGLLQQVPHRGAGRF
ncbi:hypothetical protein LP422_22185 [Janibacter limosus]|nr:hypothetical protein LP422_22185 [Janibacter limosus]